MSTQENSPHDPCIEDCSDDEEYYYNNNNNDECSAANNNNNGDMEDKNNNNNTSRTSRTTYSSFHHKLNDRPLNITVTAKVLFGSVSAISALNAERKKKPS